MAHFVSKKSPIGPSELTPNPEYLIAPLGFGPIQCLMDFSECNLYLRLESWRLGVRCFSSATTSWKCKINHFSFGFPAIVRRTVPKTLHTTSCFFVCRGWRKKLTNYNILRKYIDCKSLICLQYIIDINVINPYHSWMVYYIPTLAHAYEKCRQISTFRFHVVVIPIKTTPYLLRILYSPSISMGLHPLLLDGSHRKCRSHTGTSWFASISTGPGGSC